MNWKERLRQLKLDWLKEEAPNFFEASGGNNMGLKPYTDTKANGLTRCIIDWIKFHSGDANRINSQGNFRRINGEMKWTYGGTRRGTADIHAIYKGRHISIEIKVGKDRMSQYQNKEKQRIEKAGGLYLVIKNMDEFVDYWDSIF